MCVERVSCYGEYTSPWLRCEIQLHFLPWLCSGFPSNLEKQKSYGPCANPIDTVTNLHIYPVQKGKHCLKTLNFSLSSEEQRGTLTTAARDTSLPFIGN